MSWLRRALLLAIVVALLLFGGVADRALSDQAASAEQAARADLEETASLTTLSVRAAVARIEERVLAGAQLVSVPSSQFPVTSEQSTVAPPLVTGNWQLATGIAGLTTCHAALAAPIARPARGEPYAKRARVELLPLLSSSTLTSNGLPEAAVAAMALADPDAKKQTGDRLLSGLLPVQPNDLPYLASELGFASDPRIDRLLSCFTRARNTEYVSASPEFRRAFTERGTVEAGTRTASGLLAYELPAGSLLMLAGVGDRVAVESGGNRRNSNGRLVSVPDVSGLTLHVSPNDSGRFRIRTLRLVLWSAILTSLIGLMTMLRAVAREQRAVAKEKAFLANMTHELRTPLAAIRVFGDNLANGRGNPKEYGSLVAQESERLEMLVEQVLTLARVDEAVSFAEVKPHELVASAVRLIMPRAELRSVRMNYDNQILPNAVWDADAVRRALLNLLDNAIKHGRAGGHVEVRAVVVDNTVKIAIADDGPGIGRRDRKRIFGRFVRGASETTGTGLGLHVVEHIARAHGGRVDLVSEENDGCTFTLVLPLRPGNVAEAGPGFSPGNATDAGPRFLTRRSLGEGG